MSEIIELNRKAHGRPPVGLLIFRHTQCEAAILTSCS
jgi:hypothetical protein